MGNGAAALVEELAAADKVWHFEQAELLLGLQADQIQSLLDLSDDRIYAEQVPIFELGEKADRIFILNRGVVRLEIPNGNSRERTVAVLTGGEVFGLESLAERQAYQLQAVAHEEAWVSFITRADLLPVAAAMPKLALNIIELLVSRLGDATEDIHSLCFLDIEQRLIRTLLKLADRHGKQVPQRNGSVKLKVRISHDHLARLLGANRPYLSNIMSSFKKKGWIGYSNHRLLIHRTALEEAAESWLKR